MSDARRRRGPVDEWTVETIARAALLVLAIGSVVLAAIEDQQAIGTAFVGAAIAFGLGAAFFERVIEVSTSGVKLSEQRRLREEAKRVAPDAPPDVRGTLVSEGEEILATRRLAGEEITPRLAIKEANLAWQERNLATGTNFANWMLEHGWRVPEIDRGKGPDRGFDLRAQRDDDEVAVIVKSGGGRLDASAVPDAASIAEASQQNAERSAAPVLVVADADLTPEAAELANQRGVSVYTVGESSSDIEHLAGPPIA
jgi:hypothetical protein